MISQLDLDLVGISVELGRRARRAEPPKRGYSARPGTGPKGQRCNTCRFMQRVSTNGVKSYKCEQRARDWAQGPETDVKPAAPACADWQRRIYSNREVLP